MACVRDDFTLEPSEVSSSPAARFQHFEDEAKNSDSFKQNNKVHAAHSGSWSVISAPKAGFTQRITVGRCREYTLQQKTYSSLLSGVSTLQYCCIRRPVKKYLEMARSNMV